MAIKKELKVTTNKVLQYNISKDGYKTISGSKLINEDSTLNIRMIETSSSTLPYTIGDRIGGCATFFGYFDSINPETKEAQKYACFVLDAKYRSIQVWSGTASKFYGTPIYTNITAAKNAKESATYNTTIAVDYLNQGGYYYSRNPNGTSLIINVGDKFYSPQLPNAYELQKIWDNRVELDTYDPTLNDYPTRSLVGWGKSDATSTSQKRAISSTQGWTQSYGVSNFSYQVNDGWIYHNAVLGYNTNVFPIFEIPVEYEPADPISHYTFDANNRLVDCDGSVYITQNSSALNGPAINTGLKANSDRTYEIVAELYHEGTTVRDGALWGSRDLSATNGASIMWYNRYYGTYDIYLLTYSGMSTATSLSSGKHTFKFDNSQLMVDGSVVSTYSASTSNNYNLILGGYSESGTLDQRTFYGAIYRYKVWDSSSNLIQDLIPVYQGMQIGNYTVPSNGMFDTANQQFYGNIGSGSFVFGIDE